MDIQDIHNYRDYIEWSNQNPYMGVGNMATGWGDKLYKIDDTTVARLTFAGIDGSMVRAEFKDTSWLGCAEEEVNFLSTTYTFEYGQNDTDDINRFMRGY